MEVKRVVIPREEIKYRVGNVFRNVDKSIKGASFLVYIDARTCYDILDQMPDSWEFSWELIEGEHAVKGILTVGGRTFEDVGYPNSSKLEGGEASGEWLKDAVSDAVKRCAVQYGIGRELYSAPFLYTTEVNIRNGKINQYDPLTETGKQLIEGSINKWYEKLEK